MKKIIALSASNNPDSINYDLLRAAAGKITSAGVQLISLTGISLPVYQESIEKKEGIPDFIRQLYNAFSAADGFIIALPEHKGLLPACFKNILDWLSRINQKMFNDKPVLLLSTSPGANGGSSSLQIIAALMPPLGRKIIRQFFFRRF